MTTLTTLNENWTDLTATLSLVATNTIVLQNGAGVEIYLNESASEPSSQTRGIILRTAGQLVEFEQSTNNLYVRTSGGAGVIITSRSS